MENMGFILLGALVFVPVLYYTVRGSVEEGTLKALIEFEKIKNGEKDAEE